MRLLTVAIHRHYITELKRKEIFPKQLTLNSCVAGGRNPRMDQENPEPEQVRLTFNDLPLPLRARSLATAGLRGPCLPARSWVEPLRYVRRDPTLFAEWLTQCYGADEAILHVGSNETETIKALAPLSDSYALGQVLSWASSGGHTETVRVLLDAGAPVNGYYGHGDPLRWAAGDGNLQVVQMLLTAGADVNASANNSALHAACERSHIDVARVLLAAGANVHANDDHALRDAAKVVNNIEVIQLLLDAGANIHANLDETLHNAAVRGRIDLVRLLLKAGANVHGGNDSALREAAVLGHIDVVRMLLDAGADVHAYNNNALNRVVDYARVRSNFEMVRLLLSAGAIVTGETFAIAGNYGGNDELMNVFREFGFEYENHA